MGSTYKVHSYQWGFSGARGAIAPLLATLRNTKTQYIDIKMHQDIVIPALSVIFTLYKT